MKIIDERETHKNKQTNKQKMTEKNKLGTEAIAKGAELNDFIAHLS